MTFLIDSANLEQISDIAEHFPIAGVTTNPSIIKNEGVVDFWNQMNEIRKIIGMDKELHVQVVATDYEGIIADAKAILENVDEDIFVKVPVTKEGLKAIKQLKTENVNVTGTAVYTKMQAYLAVAAGADYVAPYFNRMENLDIDAADTLRSITNRIEQTNSNTKILAASFKNIHQINTAFASGAHVATIAVDLFETCLKMPSIDQAVEHFKADWENVYGENQTLADL